VGEAGQTGLEDGGVHLHLQVTDPAGNSTDPYGDLGVDNLWIPPCSDGIDNDGDGFTDVLGSDAGCTGPDDISEEYDCGDGVDNDLDGKIDYPDDPECPDINGHTEVPEPGRVLMLVGSQFPSAPEQLSFPAPQIGQSTADGTRVALSESVSY
jgi:hypothetical protein